MGLSVSFYKIKEIIEDDTIPREEVTQLIVNRYAKHSCYINAEIPEWETHDQRNAYMLNLKKAGWTAEEIGEKVGLQKSRVMEIIY